MKPCTFIKLILGCCRSGSVCKPVWNGRTLNVKWAKELIVYIKLKKLCKFSTQKNVWTVRIYEERRRDREIRRGKKDGIWYAPLGRQQSCSRKKAKRNFSQNQNLPRYLKRQCLQHTLFRRDLYTGLRTCAEPLKGQYHKIFKIMLQLFKFTSS